MTMVANELDKIVRKIKGLLATAEDKENINEEESYNAFLLAQKLMVKYQIKEDLLHTEITQEAIEKGANDFKKVFWYEYKLAFIIARNFRLKVYTQTVKANVIRAKSKTKIMFLGLEEDVQLGIEMYNLALHSLSFYSKRFIDNYYEQTYYIDRTRSGTQKIKNAYMQGFITGLEIKFEQNKKQLEEEYGLMIVTNEIVNKQYEVVKKTFSEKGKTFTMPSIEDLLAYEEGKKKASQLDLTAKHLERRGNENN